MSVCAGPGCTDERCGHEIPKLAVVDKLAKTLAEINWDAMKETLDRAQGIERGTRVNPAKDRSLRGKARRKARRS